MKFTTPALGLVLAFGATPVLAQMGYGNPQPSAQPQQRLPQPAPAQDAGKEPQIRPSNGALKAIIALQTAVNASDFANVPAKAAEAQKVAKTKEDRYLIGQLQLKAALASKDNAALASAIDAVAASAYLDSTKVGELYRGLGGTFYNAKQYDPAAAAFDKAIAADPRSQDAMLMLAETRNSQGRKADAVSIFQRAIQASIAAGQKPREEVYRRTVALAYDGNLPSAPELGRQWVAAYPSSDSWRNSIAIYRNLTRPDVEGTLDLLRLMQAANALSAAADYNLFATAAAEQLNYNEAQAVLDAGIAAKIVDPGSPLFKDTILALKTKPKATAADLAVATKTAQSGMALLRIGDRYYGMGDFAKAGELYRQSMGKPGVDPNIANLHLGMALTRAGDKPGATAALNAVTGERAEIAKYWLLYLQSKA
ncbi:MAG TPA: tetratricopeptide repeat protein [Sphingomicrobium sp.]|nr:tetratricopeptide repeat protein [Sphingomicrobium sp.]